MKKLMASLYDTSKKNLGAGLLIFVPIAFVVWLIVFMTNYIDEPVRSLFRMPTPEATGIIAIIARFLNVITAGVISAFDQPGAGLFVLIASIYLLGLATRSVLGNLFVKLGEAIVGRLPLIGAAYRGTKQILEPILTGGGDHFRYAVILEYPRKGIYAVGFVTSHTQDELREDIDFVGEMINIFLPTTPNPTSGFMLVVPKRDLIYLDMSVEDAVKLIISGGIVAPRVNGESIRIRNPREIEGSNGKPEDNSEKSKDEVEDEDENKSGTALKAAE